MALTPAAPASKGKAKPGGERSKSRYVSTLGERSSSNRRLAKGLVHLALRLHGFGRQLRLVHANEEVVEAAVLLQRADRSREKMKGNVTHESIAARSQ